jgi:diguanylate cyclase (GGDEF)-like protein
MQDVSGPEPISTIPRVGREAHGVPGRAARHDGERGPGAHAGHRGGQDQGDITEIAGVSDDHLDPSARAALIRLLGEIERLRLELAVKGNHEIWLERLADGDGLLPVLNRRAFVREMTRTLHRVRRSRTPAALVLVDIAGLDRIRLEHGLFGADAALAHVAAALAAEADPGDPVGLAGGTTLGAIVIGVDAAEGRARVATWLERAMQAPVAVGNRQLALSCMTGAADLAAEGDAHSIIAAADAVLRTQAAAA